MLICIERCLRLSFTPTSQHIQNINTGICKSYQ